LPERLRCRIRYFTAPRVGQQTFPIGPTEPKTDKIDGVRDAATLRRS
jgi:hypothetical protein